MKEKILSNFEIVETHQAKTGSIYLTIKRLSDGFDFVVRFSDHPPSFDRSYPDLDFSLKKFYDLEQHISSIYQSLSKREKPNYLIEAEWHEKELFERELKEKSRSKIRKLKHEQRIQDYPFVLDYLELRKKGTFNHHVAKGLFDFVATYDRLYFRSKKDVDDALKLFFKLKS